MRGGTEQPPSHVLSAFHIIEAERTIVDTAIENSFGWTELQQLRIETGRLEFERQLIDT